MIREDLPEALTPEDAAGLPRSGPRGAGGSARWPSCSGWTREEVSKVQVLLRYVGPVHQLRSLLSQSCAGAGAAVPACQDGDGLRRALQALNTEQPGQKPGPSRREGI